MDPSKPNVQTTSRQKRCHTLHIPLAKINYFLNERTNERTDAQQFFWYPRTERALRAKKRLFVGEEGGEFLELFLENFDFFENFVKGL